MSKRFTIVTLALCTSVALLVGLILAGGFTSAPIVSSAVATPPRATEKLRPSALGPVSSIVDFADVAERINAAVVNIDATSRAAGPRDPQRFFRRGPDDPPDVPGPRDPDTPRQGSGSGFIINRDGYVLTNNHVVDSAERIAITLADGRTFRAEIVGTDAAIDVALLRIPASVDLPEAPLGNSD